MGEAIAKEYLENQGYKIIEQNYRNKYAEIDLIAWDRKCLVFVEVRTKIGEKLGIPEDSLSGKKIRRIIRNATAYVTWGLGANSCLPLGYRIDAVCIVLDRNSNPTRISHYQNLTF